MNSIWIRIILIVAMVGIGSVASRTAGPIVFGLVNLIPDLIGVIGYWQSTAPEPGNKFDESEISQRRLARTAHLGSFGISAATVVIAIGAAPLTNALNLIGQIVTLVAFLATCAYARGLALRIPDQSLGDQTRTVMWGYGAALAGAILLKASRILRTAPLGATQILGLCIGIAGWVFVIWGLVLIFRYRSAMLHAARQARDSWARDAATASPLPCKKRKGMTIFTGNELSHARA